MFVVAQQLGEGDCELIHGGFFSQPANTVSSFAFMLGGLSLLFVARREIGRTRLRVALAGLTMIVVGLGSVAYHGPAPFWGQWLHDLSIVAFLIFVIAVDLDDLRSGRTLQAVAVYVGAVCAAGIVLGVVPDAVLVVFAVFGTAAFVAEVLWLQSVRAAGRQLGEIVNVNAYWVAIGALIVAGVLNLLGRTAAPLCDPDSYIQFHAVWHVLVAVAMVAYVFGRFGLGFRGAARDGNGRNSASDVDRNGLSSSVPETT